MGTERKDLEIGTLLQILPINKLMCFINRADLTISKKPPKGEVQRIRFDDSAVYLDIDACIYI